MTYFDFDQRDLRELEAQIITQVAGEGELGSVEKEDVDIGL
jgi:hypothetical protein